jgi:hypothetical protein
MRTGRNAENDNWQLAYAQDAEKQRPQKVGRNAKHVWLGNEKRKGSGENG